MGRLNKLTAAGVSARSKPGAYNDGGGLYLRVAKGGSKGWFFRYKRAGKARKMGLGPVHVVSLAKAREKASDCRRRLLDGVDPIEARLAERVRARIEAAREIGFRQCAESYIASHKAGWKNAKHADQWVNTLSAYAYPTFGDLPVSSVDVALVLKALEPIWTTKPETAARVRGRIEVVLDWAAARGFRQGENPARWRGHLDKLLPPRSKVARVRHHAALPYSGLPSFMTLLRNQEGMSARALEFAILTVARTGEVLMARRSEIDTKARMWIVPADRMKGGREHRVPLSDRAIEILETLKGSADYLFSGAGVGAPLSNMALLMTLRRMGCTDLTVHGFRSTFRDWAAEMTAYPTELCEMALAHAVSDKVEAAYRRGDMLEKRRRLMADWAAYCAMPPAQGDNVIALRAAAT